MIKLSVKLNSDESRRIADVLPGTLIKWDDKICLWTWAGLVDLTGQLFWSEETAKSLDMVVTVLPMGSIVELIQQ